MPPQHTYYDVLGLPQDADTQAIKKRYRELVRKYHPDVRQDKERAGRSFIEITEAYKTLIDPMKRSAYDGTLFDRNKTVKTEARSEVRTTPTPPRTTATARRQPVNPRVARLVKEAELAFIRRRLNEATALCKQAISLDGTCSRAHAILGDVYRARRKPQHAINEYSYAVQFDPADTASREKMEKLVDRVAPIRFSWETPDGRIPPALVALYSAGWVMVVLLLFLIYIRPGNPIALFAQSNVPLLKNWSWNLVMIMLADGALAGFLLSSSGVVNHPDEELIFETAAKGTAFLPTGFLLLIFGPFFFLGAAIIYIMFGVIQDVLSRSILTVFGVVGAIVLLSALLYTPDAMSVIILGGNVAFVGVLAGWYLGAIVRPERLDNK